MGRTVESRLVISGEDRGASRALEGIARSANQATKAFETVRQAGRASPEVDKLTRALERNSKAAHDVEALRKFSGTLASAEMSMKLARARADALAKALDGAKTVAKQYEGVKVGSVSAEMAAQIATAEQAVKNLSGQHRNAQRELRATESVVRQETRAFQDARSAVNAYGVPIRSLTDHQRALKQTLEATTKAIRDQEQAEHEAAQRHARRRKLRDDRREVAGTLAAGAGVLAAHKGKEIGLDAIDAAGEMDHATRYQHIVTDVPVELQRKLLLPQAKQIGQETRFTNKDIVEAQTAIIQALPMKDVGVRARVGAAITDNARDYATIMSSDMKSGGEGLRSYLQATRKDISTEDKAKAEATRGTNLLVKMAKMGGMNDEDVQAFIKYGFPTATAAGLSDTTVGALGAVGRRGGLRGDELGVFTRAASSKLYAPTREGHDALAAAGIKFDDYTTLPGGLSVENLENFQKRRFGKDFTDDQRGRLTDLLSNGEVVGDREEFTEQVSQIVTESFDKTKSGKTKAQDSAKIAKMVGDFHKMSIESVDTEGLLQAILGNPKMSIGLLNALFTDKHGGKASILANQFGQFKEDKAQLDKVAQDPGFARSKSKYMTEGLKGSLENWQGSWQNFVLAIGEANSGLIKFSADALAKGTDMFARLDATSQQVVSLVGGAVAAAGGAAGSAALVKKLLGIGALNGSAAALAKSATMLDAAAVKLMAGKGDVPDMTKRMSETTTDAGKAGAGAAALAVGSLGVGIAAGGAAASVMANEAVKQDPKAFGSDGGMLGALAGDYAIAGAIHEAGKGQTEEQAVKDVPPPPSFARLPDGGLSGPVRDEAAAIARLQSEASELRTTLARLSEAKSVLAMDENQPAAASGFEARERSMQGRIEAVEAQITARAGQSGRDAGMELSEGLAEGLKQNPPEVIDLAKERRSARELFEDYKRIFADGIKMPINLVPGEGFGDKEPLFRKAAYNPANGSPFARNVHVSGGLGGVGGQILDPFGRPLNAFGGTDVLARLGGSYGGGAGGGGGSPSIPHRAGTDDAARPHVNFARPSDGETSAPPRPTADISGLGDLPGLSKPGETGGDLGAVDANVKGHKLNYPGASKAGAERIQSWMDFFQRPQAKGGLGADAGTGRAMVAMMQGESSVNLNPDDKGDYEDSARRMGPTAFGTAQWRKNRFTNLQNTAMEMGLHWTDVKAQQEHMRRELTGHYKDADYSKTWQRILDEKTEFGKLKAGIKGFERPKYPELAAEYRLVHLQRLQRAGAAGNMASTPGIDPKAASLDDIASIDARLKTRLDAGNLNEADRTRLEGQRSKLAAITQQLREKSAAVAASTRPSGQDMLPRDGIGGVDQRQGNARHRADPITDELRDQLAYAGTQAGVNTEVYSGGQDPGHQHGSERHNHGRSADVRLYTIDETGKKRYLSSSVPADREKMAAFIRNGVRAGVTGIGHGPGYMGDDGIHMGGGSSVAWGANGRAANAPDWVRRAHSEGSADRRRDPRDLAAWKKYQVTKADVEKPASPPAFASGGLGRAMQMPGRPAGGFGGFGLGGASEIKKAAERMNEAADRMNGIGFHGKVDVAISGSGADQARVRGLRARGSGPMTADMGISMPQTRQTRSA